MEDPLDTTGAALQEPLLAPEEGSPSTEESDLDDRRDGSEASNDGTVSILFHTLFPDEDWKLRDKVLVEGGLPVKLVKFVTFTLASIFYVHWLVSHRQGHRDEQLRAWQIWSFDGGLIVEDAVVFFVVGRMWRKRGVDHFLWAAIVLVCNGFLEMQHYVPWLRHSFTLYEMHCTWQWQTWVYLVISATTCFAVGALHVRRAWKDNMLLMKGVEVLLFAFFFLFPVFPSPYFHFHHWFAGWLVGMHLNFDDWWSTAAMAWCHGLYINGIAVYGRSPILTCGYAYFLSWDQKCPFLECDSGMLSTETGLGSRLFGETQSFIALMDNASGPADWRNCSDNRYHP